MKAFRLNFSRSNTMGRPRKWARLALLSSVISLVASLVLLRRTTTLLRQRVRQFEARGNILRTYREAHLELHNQNVELRAQLKDALHKLGQLPSVPPPVVGLEVPPAQGPVLTYSEWLHEKAKAEAKAAAQNSRLSSYD